MKSPLDGPRNLTVNGEDVQFWVVRKDPLVKQSALVARGGADEGTVLEEPAGRERVGEYPEEELARLWVERGSG